MTIPNNLVDAAAAIKDGKLGVIEVAKIGDIIVSALTGVDAPSSLTITRKPVQSGFTITDAAVDNADDLVLDVVLANPDFSAESGITAALTGDVSQFTTTWTDKRNQLHDYKNARELLTVQTHDGVFSDMLIQSITPLYDVDFNHDAWLGTVVFVPITLVGEETTGGRKAQEEKGLGGL